MQELYEEYDALVLCTGATWPRDLPIPGRQLEGIHYAMNFLEGWQKKQMGDKNISPLMAKDKDVIIIGGGDTGCDCIATSLRQVSRFPTFQLSFFNKSFVLRFCKLLPNKGTLLIIQIGNFVTTFYLLNLNKLSIADRP